MTFQKPTFNVNEEFIGVTVITMNREFRELLIGFLGDIEEGDLEQELVAFKRALANPSRTRQLRQRRRQFQNNQFQNNDEY